MGRKKRKIAATDEEDAAPDAAASEDATNSDQPKEQQASGEEEEEDKTKQQSSGYAMTSHSGEIIHEDIYISDGSESDEGENEVNIVLVGSRMGIMRRGLHHPSMLVQPNRQWTRQAVDSNQDNSASGENVSEITEEQRRQKEEEELLRLDPAERAARLLQEKQRKMEEEKELERRRESEENAGRDSLLFSKRTAFDIRFDQIEDKPWLRHGDVSDFFNYGLNEEDWLEYAQQQIMIRQELIDARRQKRQPDPTIVPVAPKEPASQHPRVAVAVSGDQAAEAENKDGTVPDAGPVGPSMGPQPPVKNEGETESSTQPSAGPSKRTSPEVNVPVGYGGAWGAGAAPGSVLARLIEEQDRKEDTLDQPSEEEPVPSHFKEEDDRQIETSTDQRSAVNYYAGSSGQYEEESKGGTQYDRDSNNWKRQPDNYYNEGGYQNYPMPPPPPPQYQGYYGRGGRGGYDRYSGRGRRGGRGPPPPWEGRGGAEDFYGSRKRQREGGDPRWRR